MFQMLFDLRLPLLIKTQNKEKHLGFHGITQAYAFVIMCKVGTSDIQISL